MNDDWQRYHDEEDDDDRALVAMLAALLGLSVIAAVIIGLLVSR